jgi:hypothetical protein
MSVDEARQDRTSRVVDVPDARRWRPRSHRSDAIAFDRDPCVAGRGCGHRADPVCLVHDHASNTLVLTVTLSRKGSLTR